MNPKALLTFLCFIVCILSGQAQTTIHVPTDQRTIQAAINVANDGDTVLVAPGVYPENIDFTGKAITVTSSAGAATTIIDGGALSATVTFKSDEGSDSVLSGFTIRNGGPNASLTTAGGGVYISGSLPTVQNNTITANACNGLAVFRGGVVFSGNEVSGTLASRSTSCTYSGSGIAVFNAQTQFTGNTIENNVQAALGGGLLLDTDGPYLRNNIIRNNIAGDGSAIYFLNHEGNLFVQNLIYGNDSNGSAGYRSAIIIDNATGGVGPYFNEFLNNTVANNSLTAPTAASSEVFFKYANAFSLIANNIIYGSTPNPALSCATGGLRAPYDALVGDNNDIFNSSGKALVGPCTLQAGVYGNFSSDPLFTSPSTFDFHLKSGSPAVDQGISVFPLYQTYQQTSRDPLTLAQLSLLTDLDGHSRPQDASGIGYGVLDLGVYETSGASNAPQTLLYLTPGGNSYTYEQNATTPIPFTFTAQISSSLGVPTGSVIFYADGVAFGSSPINASGVAVNNSKTFNPGLHIVSASYAGNGVFSPTTASASIILIHVYTPTLTLTSSLNPSLVGQSVTLTAKITSDTNQLGPLLLTDNNGNTTLTNLTPDSTGTATYTTSTFTAGTHNLTVSYAGDPQHNAVSTTLAQQVFVYYPTTTTISSSIDPSTVGQSVTFTAQVTSLYGSPAGNVTFSDNTVPFATVPSSASGVATVPDSALTSGSHTITAIFAQTGTFDTSTASLTQNVSAGLSSAVLSVTPTTAVYGSAVSMTVTVSGQGTTIVPTGTVTFSSNGLTLASITLSSGVAGYSTSALPGGTDLITCNYSGDASFAASPCNSVPVQITSAPSTITLASSANPAAAFVPITFTASLTGNGSPVGGGQVTFTIDGSVLGTKTTSAQGTVSNRSTGLSPGSHTIMVTFLGNANFSTSSATITEIVNVMPSTAILTVSPLSGPFGTSIAMNAAVGGSTQNATPTGSVQFTSNGSSLATVPLNGGTTAAFSISTLPVGLDNISCNYSGDANFAASPCNTVPVTISGLSPTITFSVPNHVYGDPPFTVSASSNSAGTFIYSVLSGPANLNGSVVTLTGIGTVVLQANEAAAGNYTAGTQTATFSVIPASPAITFTIPNHIFGDAPFGISATSISTAPFVYSVISGPATISGATVTLTGIGTVVLQASQAAAGSYASGSKTASFVVSAGLPTIAFAVPNHTYGDLPFSVSATSNSAGTFSYSILSGPATVSGSTVSLTGAGVVSIQASQSASGSYASGSTTATFTVGKEAQTISFPQPATPINFGSGPISLSALASSGLPVSFSVLSGPATLNGSNLTVTGAGALLIAADQAGNANFSAASEITRSIIVIGRLTAIGLTATPNPVFLRNPVTLTATLTASGAILTGTVTFLDAGQPIGIAALNGLSATLSISTLSIGTHSITAVYSGDSYFTTVSSSAQSVVVQDFALTFTNPTNTIVHGGTATYSLMLNSVGGIGIPSSISFGISGAPDHSEITFSPQNVPAGSGSTPVTLTIHTPNYPVGPFAALHPSTGMALAAFGFGALLLPFGRRQFKVGGRLRRVELLALILAGTLAGLSLAGCGSGWKTQVFTIQVTATSGQLQRTATATLTSECQDGRTACPVE